MQPTYIEIYSLPDGRFGWSIGFEDVAIDQCGEEPTLKAALDAVTKIAEGETINA
jgi:hypothetical protein